MKRRSKKQADKYLDEVIGPAVEVEVEIKKPDTAPLDIASYLKFVKCIYNGPVNVRNAPSGKVYEFQPGQVLPVRNAADFHFLMSLKRNPGPGCCGGANPEPRTYFDVVSFD